MFNNQTGYSLSDIAAASGSTDTWNNGSWWIIVLFLFCFMGGGFGGYGAANAVNAATSEDVQNQFNFAALERQNNETVAAVRQAAYDVTGAVKDGNAFNQSMMKDIAYDINGELKDNAYNLGQAIRDNGTLIQNNSYEISRGVASINSNIDSVRYDNAMNTKELLASNCAQTQKILDAITTNRMADMQNQIDQLQLQAALGNVVRYPTAFAYNAGPSPFGPAPVPGPLY